MYNWLFTSQAIVDLSLQQLDRYIKGGFKLQNPVLRIRGPMIRNQDFRITGAILGSMAAIGIM